MYIYMFIHPFLNTGLHTRRAKETHKNSATNSQSPYKQRSFILIYTYMHAYLYLYIYIYMYICIHIYTDKCIYLCIDIYTFMYISGPHGSQPFYIHICIQTNVYIYVYIYKYLYTYKELTASDHLFSALLHKGT